MKLSTALINANSLHIPLANESVQMVATSPPYFSLRSYSTGANKAHELGAETLHDCAGWATNVDCGQCYICNLRAWASEIWRVLRKDGIFFLNLGDSYSGSSGAGGDYAAGGLREGQPKYSGTRKHKCLPAKNLMGIPFRAALALQADGWILRSDLIWSKPNPMPESVTDRPTKAHEYIFMFAKQAKYFYDAEAIREPVNEGQAERIEHEYSKGMVRDLGTKMAPDRHDRQASLVTSQYGARINNARRGRNSRTVWTIATAPYSSGRETDHFAAWPPALVEPMIKAGTSASGCCPACGKAWVRVTEHIKGEHNHWASLDQRGRNNGVQSGGIHSTTIGSGSQGYNVTLTWQPACQCPPHDPIPCTVLDPFCGSGTTGVVARQLGRRFVGLDLSFAYLKDCARSRLSLDALEDWAGGQPAALEPNGYHELPLFAPINEYAHSAPRGQGGDEQQELR